MLKTVSDPAADPAKKAEYKKEIEKHMTVFTDEFGEQLKVIRVGDINLPADMWSSKGKRTFRDIRDTPLRNDDVFLISYPKTGKMYLECSFAKEASNIQ